MTVEEEEEWKTESVNAILSLAPRKNDQASILKFLNTPAASEAGPSSRRHTHEAPSRRSRPSPRRCSSSTGPEEHDVDAHAAPRQGQGQGMSS